TPAGDVVVSCGETAVFTIAPGENYHIADVMVDGVPVGAVSQYEFTLVNSDHTIQVSFASNTSTITATSEGQGTISPSGEITISSGGTVTFNITPADHYHIAEVIIDGSIIGAVSTYEFSQVTDNHTIHVRFAIDTVNITATSDAYGSISPAGDVAVNWGEDITFTITPDTGYEVLQVIVDGEEIGVVNSYTFTNVTTPHTIHARFPEHLEWEWGTWNCGHNPTSEVSIIEYNDRVTVLKLAKYANYHAKIYKRFSLQNSFSIDLSYFPEAVYSSTWGPIMKIQWDNGGVAWIQDRQSGFARWGMTGQVDVEQNSILRNGKQYNLRIQVTDTQVRLLYKELESTTWNILMTGTRVPAMSGNITIILGTQNLIDDSSSGSPETYYYDDLTIQEN
ncbi:MAG: hypothetical protein JXB88_22780, partial [Spirochaetales bacterium]|nr:hypothetical protein [Spirochaetales bacterium]